MMGKLIIIAILVIMISCTISSCKVVKSSTVNLYSIGSDVMVETHIKGSDAEDSLNGNDPSVSVVPL